MQSIKEAEEMAFLASLELEEKGQTVDWVKFFRYWTSKKVEKRRENVCLATGLSTTPAKTLVLNLLKETPNLSYASIGRSIGVSRERVRQIFIEEGLKAFKG